MRFIPNGSTRLAALLAGDVQAIENVPTPDLAKVRSDASIALYSKVSHRLIYLYPDTKRDQSPFVIDKDGKPLAKNPLQDQRVRAALSMAINRDAIRDRVMEGLSEPTNNLVPKNLFGHNPALKLVKYDPEGAKKLLAAAGYSGGRLESFIMRVADIQLSFPPILIALILLALTGQGVGKIIIALVAVQWAYYARTARSAALVERKKEYIEAATALGLSPARIMLRHLLPNCLPPLIVIAALQVASAISLEATLSFLGLGLPVTEPSLGLLIANGFQYLLSGKYWISFFPGIALLLTVVAINLVADPLRDVLNPRLQTQ